MRRQLSQHEEDRAAKRRGARTLPPGEYTIRATNVFEDRSGFMKMSYRVQDGPERGSLHQMTIGRWR